MEQARLHYLNWDMEQDNHGPASTLFHKYNVESVLDEDEKPPTEFTEDDFDDLYREVAVLDESYAPDDVEQVWKRWNRTGYTEGEQFVNLRYCEECDEYVATVEEAEGHAQDLHDYDPASDLDLPDFIRGERSMSVGDVVEIDGEFYQAKAIGFEEINVGGGA